MIDFFPRRQWKGSETHSFCTKRAFKYFHVAEQTKNVSFLAKKLWVFQEWRRFRVEENVEKGKMD